MPFFFVAFLQLTLEAFRFLMCKVGILQILVRHADVRVPRLVSGNHDTLCVRKVTDAGVFQAVKLVTVGKVQRLTHLAPLVSELVDVHLFPFFYIVCSCNQCAPKRRPKFVRPFHCENSETLCTKDFRA